MTATATEMTPKQARKYIQELLGLAKELKATSDKCARLGIERINLGAAMRQISQRLEDLPILSEGVADRHIMYFVLSGEGWWPAHGGYEASACGMDHWLNYRIEYDDGSVESGVCQPYRWAHCTMDDTPNYHWFDKEVEDEDVHTVGVGLPSDGGA